MERTSDLKRELRSFPSYLKSCEDLGTCSKKKLKQILDRIISDLETYDYEVERIRDLNLAAFLYLEIGDKAHALEYIDKALSSNSRNVNALVLKGWYYLKSVDIYECDQILKRLGPLRNDSTEVLHAKAELAYIYTRIGIKFYDKSIKMFDSIFSEIDQNKLAVDPIAFVVWKFGLALTMKRTLNLNNLHEQNEFNFTMEKVKATLKVYSDIYESQIDKRYMARSLVEIGELLNKATSQEHVKRLQAVPGLPKKPVGEYFKEALNLCDSDAFVLQRCGRYYRYQNNVEQSIELLRKSIQGRYHEYNSYGHHHLALSLKRELENSLQRTYFKRGGQYRPTNNSRRGRMQRGARGFNEHRELKMDSNTGLAYDADLGPDSGCHALASGGYYGPRFSRERTRARSSRRRQGRCRNFRKFRGTDDSSQSRPSGSPLPFEEIGKTAKLQELLVKSPQNLISLEDADKHKVTEILDHLDKAHRITGNIAALYDKGLTLRALGRYDDALIVFKLFFEEDSSLVYLANAYEQSAFCMISKLENLKDEREREKITCNLQHWLSACIEISYRTIMQKYPDCKYCWASESVLEVILSKKDRTKESRKELCDFYRKVEDYTRAIDIAEDLLTLGGDQEDQYATRMKMIDDYYNLQQYDKAILTINLIGNQMDDVALFHKVHLEGGFQSYVKGELELAKTRLKTALNRSCRKIQDVSDGDEKEEADTNDIFILCSENNEDCPRQVKQGLENLGLQVTVNFDNVRPYETRSAVLKVMKSSSHFVCFLEQGNTVEDDPHMTHWLEVIKNVHVERGSGHILFIKKDQMTDIPTNFTHFPSMEYDNDMAEVAQSKKMDETQIQWLKILLQKLVKDLQK